MSTTAAGPDTAGPALRSAGTEAAAGDRSIARAGGTGDPAPGGGGREPPPAGAIAAAAVLDGAPGQDGPDLDALLATLGAAGPTVRQPASDVPRAADPAPPAGSLDELLGPAAAEPPPPG